MKAIVTAIGQYNGAPAFEYEVREDDDRLLGFDYVIIHPHAGETWDDLAGFMEHTYLPVRLTKWALTDGDSRAARREVRIGGVRLANTDAPEVSGGKPQQGHRPSVSMTREQAEERQRGAKGGSDGN
jgi:hypothetical protein